LLQLTVTFGMRRVSSSAKPLNDLIQRQSMMFGGHQSTTKALVK